MNHQTHETNDPVSIWPILLAAGLSLLLAGVVYSPIISIIGLVLLLVSIAGWTQENRVMALQEVEVEEEEEVSRG
jgi:hypothetical protein